MTDKSSRRANTIGRAGRQVSANLMRLRRMHGLSMRTMAEHLERDGWPIGANAVYRIESGARRADTDDLVHLAAVLGVTVQDLVDPPTDCETCRGTPPPGFRCQGCGTNA